MEIRENQLWLGGCSAEELVRAHGTPLYVYEEALLRERCQSMRQAFHAADADLRVELHYAMKANSNPALLGILREEGLGIDAVSPGELRLALESGFKPEQICFTGNNCSAEELRFCQDAGVIANVGSLSELHTWGTLAPGSAVGLRLNPDVLGGNHRHLVTAGANSKFGLPAGALGEAQALLERFRLRLLGVHAHIGSGILEAAPLLSAMDALLALCRELPVQEFIDFGGGFGVPYHTEERPLALGTLAQEMTRRFRDFERENGRALRMKLEPGRWLVAPAGVLLARVTQCNRTPQHFFVGVDSGFNHLIRPAFYGAFHRILNASKVEGAQEEVAVVGNLCESGDIFTQNAEGITHQQITRPEPGQLLVFLNAGAYGMVQSSQYNLRPRPAEVLVSAGQARLIRRRESYADLVSCFVR